MRLLIADDDPTTRVMLKGVVARWGYETTEAADGVQAWDALTTPDAPCLALLDWMMPGFDGPELCRRLKVEQGHRPKYLILLTARGEREDVVHGLDSGADDYVIKPYNGEELRARLDVGRRVVELRRQLQESNQDLEERVAARTRDVERLLHEKEDLIMHLGHDLKTPLTPLLALLPMLLASEQSPERKQMLELASESAGEISNLVARVLELCRIEAATQHLQTNARSARALVDGALRALPAVRLAERREIRNEIPADTLVLADASILPLALSALLDNAIRFSRPGGRIVARARTIDRQVILEVSDDGEGIPASQLETIFGAFQKVDPSRHDRHAAGLGLTMARRIAERHGGQLSAFSEGPGRGATFRLTLPAPTPASTLPAL